MHEVFSRSHPLICGASHSSVLDFPAHSCSSETCRPSSPSGLSPACSIGRLSSLQSHTSLLCVHSPILVHLPVTSWEQGVWAWKCLQSTLLADWTVGYRILCYNCCPSSFFCFKEIALLSSGFYFWLLKISRTFYFWSFVCDPFSSL